MSDRSFLFVLGSARRDGNAEILARLAAEQLDADQRWIHLEDLPLAPFEDVRTEHEDEPHTPTGNEKVLYDATTGVTDLVIVSPTYWYSVSNTTKRYLDHWSNWLRTPGFKDAVRGDTLWGVTALTEDKSRCEPLVGTLRNSAGYLRMRFGGVLIGNGDRPGDVLADTEAVAEAKTFFAG
ncbi:NAD(P)H-dependent oxidoreductase [Actinosynnema sp. NPDC020468]|uniref:flavodoxin family protein n=1 Tax=Actinosynnema sp. NPDC020468 TaxID=3154488 RepID=UPI0033ED0C76